jgi:hypothetical protein
MAPAAGSPGGAGTAGGPSASTTTQWAGPCLWSVFVDVNGDTTGYMFIRNMAATIVGGWESRITLSPGWDMVPGTGTGGNYQAPAASTILAGDSGSFLASYSNLMTFTIVPQPQGAAANPTVTQVTLNGVVCTQT